MAAQEAPEDSRTGWALIAARIGSYLVLLGVIPLLLGMLVAFAFAGGVVVRLIDDIGTSSGATAAVQLAKAIDLVLIGVVLFVVATGLTELFSPPLFRARLKWLPAWLAVESLDDLKEPVLSTLVIIIAVGFVDELAAGATAIDALGLGVGSAAVITAIGIYRKLSGR
ncbi:MAG TPA: YqhA family protein [Candidatus Dormibacteraeota bacterium]|jgi:uncharacterized membrane protein YqhA|nr:YqhA family protein [Candidatus Dormibacteraeota bacterium]